MGIIWLLVLDSFLLPHHRLILIGTTTENVKIVMQLLEVLCDNPNNYCKGD